MLLDKPLRPWPLLGSVPTSAWSPAREELHAAVQLLGSVGKTLVEARDDYGHEALFHRPGSGVLNTMLTRGNRRLRAALAVEELVLLVLGQDEAIHGGFPLQGRTYAEAVAWLEEQFSSLNAGAVKLEPPTHELPQGPIFEGQAFTGEGAEVRSEIEKLFCATQDSLAGLQRQFPRSSPIRVWPHHFDLATLIPLDPDGVPPKEARSIGVGVAPGSPEVEPYLYVLPWPKPAVENLPQLPLGMWNTEGWIGARLDLSEILALSALDRGDDIEDFIAGAVRSSHELLGAS